MIQQFINREAELKFLEDSYTSKRAELIVIYGRRRIGKTEIISKFCEGKPNIYLLCTEYNEKDNLEMFKNKFAEFTEKQILKELDIKSWFQLFERFLELLDKKEKIIIAIDEFSFLIGLNTGIVSMFQKIWDELLQRRNLMIILSGSSVSMMENEVLSYKSPLYGRRTGQWKVDYMNLESIKKFFPKYSIQEIIETNSVVGGVPAYLNEFDGDKKLFENIKEKILRKGKYLYQEVEFLLKQEFREHRTYITILKKIASGYNGLGKLCSATAMNKGNISKYLYVLEELRIIKHILPLGKRKGGIYLIVDNFFNFWLKMVSPYLTEIEIGNIEEVIKAIEKNFSQYMGGAFEQICEKAITTKNIELPIKITGIHKWWQKDKEIDIVCVDENKKEVLFVECKWSDIDYGEAQKIIEELKEKSKYVDLKRSKEEFCIIARKIKQKEKLKKENYLVFDLEDFKI